MRDEVGGVSASIRHVEIFISLSLHAEHFSHVYRNYEDELEAQFPQGPKSCTSYLDNMVKIQLDLNLSLSGSRLRLLDPTIDETSAIK